jgi:hypothetical protein
MQRFVLAGILLVFVTLSMANEVSAVASGPPTNDSFVRVTAVDTNFNALGLSVAASTSSCNPTDTIYLKWDLANIPVGKTVHTASLTLTSNYVSSTSGATLALYRTSDDYAGSQTALAESELTANNAPAPEALIETQPAPTVSSQTVVFDSAALASYVNAEAGGDKMVSFVIRFSQGCNTLDLVRFDDHESGASGPDLQLQDPTVVHMQSVRGLGFNLGIGAFLVITSALILVLARFWQHPTSEKKQ